jgi:hypothetical protein
MFEWQSRLTKAWFDVAQAGAQAMADTYLSASRETSRMFNGGHRTFPVGASAFPFPWMSPFAPAQPQAPWPFSSAMWPMTPGFGLGTFAPMAAFNPWASTWAGTPWTFGSPPTPAQATASFLDAIAASYRTAGGHAVTMILTPFQLAPQPAKRAWWEWPASNRSFLLH